MVVVVAKIPYAENVGDNVLGHNRTVLVYQECLAAR